MENLFERKSTLAKLLAQENLSVEHRNVPTAYFDLETRTIVLPNYREMDSETYDLMTGHEVGHAFYTPAEGWHSAVENNKSLKSYLNVIEDTRIERKIKEKYPGLRRSFNIAYKKLHEQDFFGLAGIDVRSLKFIDRINIFYKLGAHVTVGFTPEELKYIDRINVAQSWEDVRQIATELHALAKEEKKKQAEQNQKDSSSADYDPEWDDEPSDESEDSDDDRFDSLFGDDDYDSDSDEESEDDDYDSASEDSDSEEFKDGKLSESDEDGSEESDVETKNGKKAGSGYDDNDDSEDENLSDIESPSPSDEEVESITDRAFRANEQNLIDGSLHNKTVFVPKFKPETVVPHKIVHGAIKAHIENLLTKDVITGKYDYCQINPNVIIPNMRNVAYKEFVARSAPMVNYMVKEFEMRKNATQLSRAKVAKSGEVDVNKLSRYTLGADIFKRVTTIQQGKNHGLVLFIDLSGSMNDILLKTFEQAIALTLFCKKVNIPFEVYGFSNNPHALPVYDGNYKNGCKVAYVKDHLALKDPSFHLKQYLDSNMSQTDYREACMNMLYIGKAHLMDYSLKDDFIPNSEIIYGTPLDEAVGASIEVVSRFKSVYNLDNVNCIFLTDGEGGVTSDYFVNDKGHVDHSFYRRYNDKKNSFYLQYPGTNIRVRYQNKVKITKRSYSQEDRFISTRALIEVAKKVTGAKYTGYYICDKRKIPQLVYPYEFMDPRDSYSFNKQNHDLYRQQMKSLRDKITSENFVSCNKFGFDEYFFIADENLEIKHEKIVVPDNASKNKLAKAFMNSVKSRNLQRMFLNRFMQNIAA